MKITAEDKHASLEILRNDLADPYRGYTMRLVVQTSDGVFSRQNDCVHLSRFPEFLSAFGNLVRSRDGEATLELTEDCRVHFFRWNLKGDLGCSATVSKFVIGHDPSRTTPVSITAEFKLDTEVLNTMQSEFEEMKDD